MADTVQSGSALSAATWGGSLPTGGETANVHHAITGPSGTLDAALVFQSGGSLETSGDFAITGAMSSVQRDTTPVSVPALTSLDIGGDAVGQDGDGGVDGVALILFSGTSLRIRGDATGGSGEQGESGGAADGEGGGSEGAAGAHGAPCVIASGSGAIQIDGDATSGSGGHGGNGGNGHADEYGANNGGGGGVGGNGGGVVASESYSGNVTVGGTVTGGNGGGGGYGGSGAHWDDGYETNYDGSGGNGAAGGAAAKAIVTGGHVTVAEDSLGGNAFVDGGPGSDPNPGAGGSGADGADAIAAGTVEIQGDVVKGEDAGVYTGGMGASVSVDGSELFGLVEGISGGKLVVIHGEVRGSNNSATFTLPAEIAEGELVYFHPDYNFNSSLDLEGVVCECSGAIVIVKTSELYTIAQDSETEIVLAALDAHAIAINVEIPIASFVPDFPEEGDVRDGVEYGGTLEGTLTVPIVSDVQYGVQYGAGGTEYTGTLAGFTSSDRSKLEALHDQVGKLDSLPDSPGLAATQADVQAITQAQRIRIAIPPQMERPDEDSTAYRIWIYAYNAQHTAENLDAVPVVTAENHTGSDRSANLGTVTKPAETTGIYYVDYTVASTHAVEGVVVKVAATEGAVTTNYATASIVVDTTAVDFTASDRIKLDAIAGIAAKTDSTLEADGDNYRLTAAALAALPATLTEQDVANSMLLAPIGEAADGSVVDVLEQIETNAIDEQDVADSMKIAPSSGANAPLSVQGRFDTNALWIMAWQSMIELSGSNYRYTSAALANAPGVNQQQVADSMLLAPNGNAAESSPHAILVALKTVGDKLNTTVQQTGAAYQFTTEALALGPSSSVNLGAQDIANAMAKAAGSGVDVEANSVLARLIALKGKADVLAAGSHAQTVPVSTDGKTITITRGDSYTLARGSELRWLDRTATWRDLGEATGATFTMAARAGGATIITKAATIDLEGSRQSIYVELDADETDAFPIGSGVGKWDIEVQWADGSRWTLPVAGNGKATVQEDVTR